MTKDELLSNLPAEFTKDLVPEIYNLLVESKKTIVVLDDDPTGTQTVFDVPVLTDLNPDLIKDAIDEAPPVLFLLTNSRSLTPTETTTLHQSLGEILKEFQDDIIVISRSDSTLRGHFPLETDTLRHALGIPEAPTLFIPFCKTTNALTVNDTHYVIADDIATPANLNLKPGTLAEARSLSLADLRSGDITEKLAQLPDSSNCIVNAASLTDLNVLSLALLKSDRRFIIRSAASFVQSLAGIVSRPPLDPWQLQDLDPNPNGGLIIIGSHLPTTTAQLNHLLKNAPNLVAIKLSVPDIVNCTFNLENAIAAIQEALTSGKTVALFTSRKRSDGEENPALSRRVSQTLVDIVKEITVRPSFFIAKGGITSSEIATKGLGVKQAMVLGQILPGVSVWTIGNETRHPGLAYVVFPGNVGSADALTQALQKLTS